MLQIIAAGARAAKAAVKAARAAKKAKAAKAAKSSREFKDVGDSMYNARRRFTRAAQRNLDKAEETTGSTSAHYRNLAKQDLEKALQTYDQKTTQQFSRPIRELADSLNVDLSQSRLQLKQAKTELVNRMRENAENESYGRLESVLQDSEVRRQAEAQSVFNSPVGQRIIGGLVDVWKSEAVEIGVDGKQKVNKAKMMKAIFDYFGTDNLADVLKKVEEELGESLYRQGDKDEIYETVKLQIQNKVADNTLVA